jgi:DNA repair protein RAD5
MLISLKAGSLGINLTAANHVFLVDPWWNPAVEDQAIDRVYRIGQNKKVSIIRLICSKTIEERILKLNEDKKKLIKKTIQSKPEERKRRNIENLQYILQDFEEE